MCQKVLQAVGQLPTDEREVTALFYIDGYSQRQIADFLEVPVSTVKDRLHTARQRLKRRMLKMVSQELQASKPGPEFSARLFNGINLDKWVILSDSRRYEIENGELIVDGGLHAEVGGMSWDDYRVSVDVLVERDSSPGKAFPFNVQWCPHGTCVFCQLFGDNIILAYWDKDRDEHFTHLGSVPKPMPLGAWHRFEIQVEGGGVAIFLNGQEVIQQKVPCGTGGMLGLLVNVNSDARVRLRNLQITFLRPTAQQLKELQTDAATNWEEFKRREVLAGRRKSTDDNSL